MNMDWKTLEDELCLRLFASPKWAWSTESSISDGPLVGLMLASLRQHIEVIEPWRKGWLIRIHGKRSGISGETFGLAVGRAWWTVNHDLG